jgi:hypothetical protein
MKRLFLVVAVAFSITIATPSVARDCPLAAGHWGSGPIGRIEIEGGLGLVASGAVLQVVDVSQPATITTLGEIELPGVIRSLALISDRWALVAADRGGLWLVSLANPAAPGAVDLGFEDPVALVDVGDGGHHAYVVEDLPGSTGPETRFTILDVNQPMAPDRLGWFEVEGSAQDMALDGDFIYLAMADHSLIQVYVGTPLWPSWQVHHPVSASDQGLPVRIAVCDGTIYLVTHAHGGFETNTTVHSLVPGSLSLNWTRSWMELIFDIECADDDLLLSGGWGMTALDVSLSPPTKIGGIGVWRGPSVDIEFIDGRIFLADGLEGLKTYDGSDLSDIEQIGILQPSELYFPGFASARIGDYLIGAGWHLSVVDVEDPSQPRLAATEGYGYYSDIVISGSHAFVASNQEGVRIYDLSSPEVPNHVHTIVAEGAAHREHQVFLRNDHLLSVSDAVRVFGVSNPTEPQLVTTINVSGTAHLTADDRLLVGNSDGLMVIDASDLAAPSIAGVLATDWNDPGSTVIGLTARGDHAFVTTYASNPWRGEFHVVDLTLSRSPVLLGSVALDGPAFDLIVRQDIVIGGMYKGEEYSGNLVTIDVADPTRPFVIAEIEVGVPDPTWQAPTPMEVYGLFDDGPVAYVSLRGRQRHALRVLDLADPAHPRLAGTMPAPGATTAVAASNGIAVTGEAGGGVRFFEVNGFGTPREIGFLQPAGFDDHALHEGVAYVDTIRDGLLVVDLLGPRIVNRLDLPHRGVLDASEGKLFRATAWHLKVYDLSDPLVPSEIGSIYLSIEPGPTDISVDGGLGVIVWPSGFGIGAETLIRVLDASNPALPVNLGVTSHPGSPTAVAITGQTLFLTTIGTDDPERYGLSILDLTNPASPVVLSTTTTPGDATGVTAFDNVAYVSDSEHGVLILDITDPIAPVEIGWLDTPGNPQALAIDGGTLVVADGAGGLTAFTDWPCPVSDPAFGPSVVD